jgi:hypothetical protein
LHDDLQNNFQEVLRRHTAGDPMREDVQWTNLTKTEIAQRLGQLGTPVSVNSNAHEITSPFVITL